MRQVAVTLAIALIGGALMNAGALVDATRTRPFGPDRDRALFFWEPVESVADALLLTEPRAQLDEALGRAPVEPATVALPVPTTTTAPPGATTTAPTTTTTPPIPELDPPTPEDRMPFLVAGDSMVETYGTSQQRIAAETGVFDATLEFRVSSGLIRPDFFNWPEFLTQKMEELDPGVVVLMFGANDHQPLQYEDGTLIEPLTPEWQAVYRQRVGETMDLVADDERLLFWVGMPNTDFESGYADKMAQFNVIYREEAEKRPGVIYVNSWPLFSDPAGNYAYRLPAEDGTERIMRQGDHLHFSTSGGDRLSWAVLEIIDQYVSLAASQSRAPADIAAPGAVRLAANPPPEDSPAGTPPDAAPPPGATPDSPDGEPPPRAGGAV